MTKRNIEDASKELLIVQAVYIPASLDEWLTKKAEKWNCSRNEVVVKILLRWFKKDCRRSLQKKDKNKI